MSEEDFLQLVPLIKIAAPILLVVGLIWGISILRRSLETSQGDLVSMELERLCRASQWTSYFSFMVWPLSMLTVIFLETNILVVFFVCLFLSGSLYIVASFKRSKYNQMFKEKFVTVELAKVFADLKYLPGERFSNSELDDLGLFKSLDRVSGNDLIEAEYKGRHFRQCDLQVEEKYIVEVKDSEGETREEERYRYLFRGRAMRFDFADEFASDVRLCRKNFSGTSTLSAKIWQKVETELVAFNDDFNIVTRDPLAALTILTPQMIEGIFYLDKSVNAPMALYFKGWSLYVFIAISREAFDVSSHKTLLEEQALVQQDIKFITDFIDMMYFKKEI